MDARLAVRPPMRLATRLAVRLAERLEAFSAHSVISKSRGPSSQSNQNVSKTHLITYHIHVCSSPHPLDHQSLVWPYTAG